MNSAWKVLTDVVSKTLLSPTVKVNSSLTSFITSRFASLNTLHMRYIKRLENPVPKTKVSPLLGRPFAKGVVLKTLIKKPKKPNSANRKCVYVKLSFGKEIVAFVPGEGHNLQEHQVVLVCGRKLKDTPGVKVRCVRGAYDLPHVSKGGTLK